MRAASDNVTSNDLQTTSMKQTDDLGDPTGPIEPEKCVIRTVKFFSYAKGCGFLDGEGSADIFVSIDQLRKAGLPSLKIGDVVKFETGRPNNKPFQAVNLRIVAPSREWDDPANWMDYDSHLMERFSFQLARCGIDAPFAFHPENMRAGALPYYDGTFIVSICSPKQPTPNEFFCLWSPLRGKVLKVDWTERPIYAANELFACRLDEDNAAAYLRFFFRFVTRRTGRVLHVDNVVEMPWLKHATEAERATMARQIFDFRLVSGDKNPQNFLVLQGTVLINKTLYVTTVMVARETCDLLNPNGTPEHFTIGQVQFIEKTVLIDGLEVRSDLRSNAL